MAKALNMGVLAWSPLAGGVLTGKYHGEGKADGGRMTNEVMKEFLPGEQRAAPIISAVKSISEQTGRGMAPSRTRVVAPSKRCAIERCQ